eukprot:s563_g14.t1
MAATLALCAISVAGPRGFSWPVTAEELPPVPTKEKAPEPKGFEAVGLDVELANGRKSVQVGDLVSGFVRDVWRSFVFVDIGTERDARLELSEIEDGFPGRALKAIFIKQHRVSSRVLEVGENGAIFLTQRSGDLARPPRLQKQDVNRDPEMLEKLPKGITFQGQVADFLPTGVFVHVFRHPDEKPLLGFLPMFLFAPGFDRIAVRGLRIEVQKKGFDPDKGLLLTMLT